MKATLAILALLLQGMACYSQGTVSPDSALSQSANNGTSVSNSAPVHRLKSNDRVLPPWTIDLNYRIGWMIQDIQMIDLKSAYANNSRSVSTSKYVEPTFSNGLTSGGDVQLGYFFNKGRTLGVSIGAMYMHYIGNMALDTLHADYETIDSQKKVYRQIINTNEALREDVKINNLNIPVLLKFKHQFGRPEHPSNFGITADAGPVFGIYNQTIATVSGYFSYEAVYQLTDGKQADVSGFDGSTTPHVGNTGTSLVLTKDAYDRTHADKQSEDYLDENYRAGYNVGLNKSVAPSLRTQNEHYTSLSLGVMAQAGLSYAISYNINLNLSGYYMYQSWQNTNNEHYKPTEKVVSEGTGIYVNYTPLTGGIKKSDYSSYGFSAGLRIFFGDKRDVDGDGIPDAKDKCKLVYGEKRFGGCPDSDHDGIPDTEDDCPDEPGGEATLGCPDDDNDGVPNKVDQCPYTAGQLRNGCPIDTNYIISSNTSIADMPVANIDSSLTRENGTFLPPHQVLETDVLHFAYNRADIQDSAAQILDFAANLLAKEARVVIYISGYTDDIGSIRSNVFLSYQRAKSAQIYLMKKGVAEDRIILGGHGMENPVTPNNSPENRAKNRRIEMKLLLPL